MPWLAVWCFGDPASRTGPRAGQVKKPKRSKWRAQHQELQAAIRAMRGGGRGRDPWGGSTTGGSDADASAFGTNDYSNGYGGQDFVPCPHCHRTFSESTAERHIPKCKTTIARPRPPPQVESGRSFFLLSFSSPLFCCCGGVFLCVSVSLCLCAALPTLILSPPTSSPVGWFVWADGAGPA